LFQDPFGRPLHPLPDAGERMELDQRRGGGHRIGDGDSRLLRGTLPATAHAALGRRKAFKEIIEDGEGRKEGEPPEGSRAPAPKRGDGGGGPSIEGEKLQAVFGFLPAKRAELVPEEEGELLH